MKNKFTLWVVTALSCYGLQANAQTFPNKIPMPPRVTGTTFNLVVDTASWNFNPGRPSDTTSATVPTMCYNIAGDSSMKYLGPTLVFQVGQQVNINVTNKLNQRTTVHWHGLNLPSAYDGGPHEAIDANNGTWHPSFTIVDSAQTVWYHSHLMDSTTFQVIMGLAGMIQVVDPNEPREAIYPRDYSVNDLPIVFQEKAFTLDSTTGKVNGLFVGQNIHNPGNGNFTIINGMLNGMYPVPAEFIRLRFLNGSPRKAFQMGLSSQLKNPSSFNTMWLVATDGGYTNIPTAMNSILMAPGERMEMIVNLTNKNHGDTIYLNNLAASIPSDIIGSGVKATPGHAFMAFVVDTTIHSTNPVTSLPTWNTPYVVDTTNIFKYRTKHLMNDSSNLGGKGGLWTIDGDTMNMEKINDTILVDTKEMWTIVNRTNVSHPFHIHKVQFQVVFVADTLGDTTYYPNLPANLRGWKDDVLVRAYHSVGFVTTFSHYPDTMIDPMNGFMYHCHILPHEDGSMMNQFVVVDSMTYYGMEMGLAKYNTTAPVVVYPNPAGDVLNIQGLFREKGTIRVCDILGRTLLEQPLMPFSGNTTLDVSGLPRGFVFVELSTPSGRETRKILLR